MPRKGHKKSRAGCFECKRRHLKCDEVHPVCGKCAFSSRECVYGLKTATPYPPLSVRTTPNALAASNTSDDPSMPIISASGNDEESWESFGASDKPTSCAQIDTNYLELFYNFEHETCRTVVRTEAHIDAYRRTIIRRAFVQPHLMHAILGFSALHAASTWPDREKYQHLAAVLQGKALEDFNAVDLQNINESNVTDLLLFQHTTALHVFCDIFSSLDANFSDFMDRLVGCIRLLRGLDSVIGPWWEFLSHTELGIILLQSSDSLQKPPPESLNECVILRSMATQADLSSASIDVCLDSISRLQAYFDAENMLDDQAIGSTNVLFSWLVTASAEYTQLLEERRPEALIILAYYAVLLHRRRRCWAVQDSGQKLLQQIKRYLGRKWEHLLSWPESIVFGDQMALTG